MKTRLVKKVNKTLALFMALMLVFGLSPMALFADNDNNEVKGSFSIQKTVDSKSFGEWAAKRKLSSEDVGKIIAGMSFTAYKLGGDNAGSSYTGVMDANGLIRFSKDIPIGKYEVVEKITGKEAEYYFGDKDVSYVFDVTEYGFNVATDNFVSGQGGIGKVVKHDGSGGVNWQLPKVWDDFFTIGTADAISKSNYAELKGMGAQWIWNRENTYVYGVSGSAIEFKFEVNLDEATVVPFYFAADNVAMIYINGKLAAYTTVALEKRNIKIGDKYTTNVLGELLHANFDGRWSEGWNYAYKADVTLVKGINEIIILAGNSASNGYIDKNGDFVKGNTNTDNDTYDLTNNPCGLIFSFGIPKQKFAATFNNHDAHPITVTKQVRDPIDGSWGDSANIYDGGSAEYKITVTNNSGESTVYLTDVFNGTDVFKEADINKLFSSIEKSEDASITYNGTEIVVKFQGDGEVVFYYTIENILFDNVIDDAHRFENVVTWRSVDKDGNDGDKDTAVVTVSNLPDIDVEKKVYDPVANAWTKTAKIKDGESAVFEITVTNSGGEGAVYLNDIFNEKQITNLYWDEDCNDLAYGATDDGNFEIKFDGADTKILYYKVDVPTFKNSDADSNTYKNVVTWSTNDKYKKPVDGESGNDDSTKITVVAPIIGITKTIIGGNAADGMKSISVDSGSNVTFQISISNSGTAAGKITLDDCFEYLNGSNSGYDLITIHDEGNGSDDGEISGLLKWENEANKGIISKEALILPAGRTIDIYVTITMHYPTTHDSSAAEASIARMTTDLSMLPEQYDVEAEKLNESEEDLNAAEEVLSEEPTTIAAESDLIMETDAQTEEPDEVNGLAADFESMDDEMQNVEPLVEQEDYDDMQYEQEVPLAEEERLRGQIADINYELFEGEGVANGTTDDQSITYKNIATVSLDDTVAASDYVDITVVPSKELTIEKEVSADKEVWGKTAEIENNGIAYFRITVTNTGEGAVDEISLTDVFVFGGEPVDLVDMTVSDNGAVNDGLFSLAAEQTAIFYYETGKLANSYCDKVANYVNTATITYNDINDEPVCSDSSAVAIVKAKKAATAIIEGTKTLDGVTPEERQFQFVLSDDEGNTIDTAYNDADGKFSFGELSFKQTGEYHYTVSEQRGSDSSIAYDRRKFNVTITVEDKGESLTTQFNYGNGDIAFKNHRLNKELTIRKEVSADEITWDDNAAIEANGTAFFRVTVTNTGNARINNIKLTDSLDDGTEISIDGADSFSLNPGKSRTLEYDVTLTNEDFDDPVLFTNTAIVTYTDIGGETQETSDSAEVTVKPQKSVYATIVGKKTLTGATLSADQFSFVLRDETGNMVATATNSANGEIRFEGMRFTRAGEYQYTVSEQKGSDNRIAYDHRKFNVTITVMDTDDGLTAKVKYDRGNIVFINHLLSRKLTIEKEASANGIIWDDPAVIEAGGTAYFRVTVTNTGNARINNIKLTDILNNGTAIAIDGADSFSLNPGKAAIFEYSVPLANDSFDEIAAFTNTAKVTYTDSDGEEKEASDWTEVTVKPKKSVYATIVGKKTLTGATLVKDMFSFNLLDESGNTIATATNDANGDISFEKVCYTEPGIYRYTVFEQKGNDSRIAYDRRRFNVVIKVTDTDDGLTAQVKYDRGSIVFMNHQLSKELSIEKEVSADGIVWGDPVVIDASGTAYFRVTVTNTGDARMEKINLTDFLSDGTELLIDGAGSFSLNPGKSATFKYSVPLANESFEKISTLTNMAIATYTDIEGEIKKISDSAEVIIKPRKRVYASIAGKKTFTGALLSEGQFEFVLRDEAGNTVATATNNANGEIRFDNISFTKTGEYNYTVSEKKGSDSRINYDSTIFTVTITVTDTGEELAAQIKYDKGAIAFTNHLLSKDLKIEKQASADGITWGDSARIEADNTAYFRVTVTNIGEARIDNIKLTDFLNDGRELFSDGANSFSLDPGQSTTFRYSETLSNESFDAPVLFTNTATATYTDNTGEPKTTSDSADVTVNPQKSAYATIIGTKTLTGATLTAGQFSFNLRDESGNTVATATNSANGEIRFENVRFTEAGTYRYTISEQSGSNRRITYDGRVFNVEITVIKTAGVLNDPAQVTYPGGNIAFVNTYTSRSRDNSSDDGGSTTTSDNGNTDNTEVAAPFAPLTTFAMVNPDELVETDEVVESDESAESDETMETAEAVEIVADDVNDDQPIESQQTVSREPLTWEPAEWVSDNYVPTQVPDVYVLLDEEGVPLGYFTPVLKDGGDPSNPDDYVWIETDEYGVPLGAFEMPAKENPKTGQKEYHIDLGALFTTLMLAVALIIMRFMQKMHFEK